MSTVANCNGNLQFVAYIIVRFFTRKVFNVYNWNDTKNFYRTYSVQGRNHSSHYSYEFAENGDRYTFIGVDACLGNNKFSACLHSATNFTMIYPTTCLRRTF